MITDAKQIEAWFAAIPVSEFDGVQVSHVYAMAEIAYEKGMEKAAKAERERYEKLKACANALVDQIDRNDFTDSHGHPVKNIKALHDLMQALTDEVTK